MTCATPRCRCAPSRATGAQGRGRGVRWSCFMVVGVPAGAPLRLHAPPACGHSLPMHPIQLLCLMLPHTASLAPPPTTTTPLQEGGFVRALLQRHRAGVRLHRLHAAPLGESGQGPSAGPGGEAARLAREGRRRSGEEQPSGGKGAWCLLRTPRSIPPPLLLRPQPVEGAPRQAPGAHVSEALRVYEGHSNEKNFVGLAGERPWRCIA